MLVESSEYIYLNITLESSTYGLSRYQNEENIRLIHYTPLQTNYYNQSTLLFQENNRFLF